MKVIVQYTVTEELSEQEIREIVEQCSDSPIEDLSIEEIETLVKDYITQPSPLTSTGDEIRITSIKTIPE